jgi:hypothetical protein
MLMRCRHFASRQTPPRHAAATTAPPRFHATCRHVTPAISPFTNIHYFFIFIFRAARVIAIFHVAADAHISSLSPPRRMPPTHFHARRPHFAAAAISIRPMPSVSRLDIRCCRHSTTRRHISHHLLRAVIFHISAIFRRRFFITPLRCHISADTALEPYQLPSSSYFLCPLFSYFAIRHTLHFSREYVAG